MDLVFPYAYIEYKMIVGSLQSTQEETSCVLQNSTKIIVKVVLEKKLREPSALNCEIQGD